MKFGTSFSVDYFEDIYERSPDPWGYGLKLRRGRYYEQRKYLRTYRSLPTPSYANVLEIGCSIGVFTRLLARRSRNLLAIDFSPTALAHARVRCAQLPNVRFEARRVPEEFPSDRYDLIVMSEVAYYLSEPDFDATCDRIADQLIPGGHLVMVHYRGLTTDAAATGEAYHQRVRQRRASTLHLVEDRGTERYCLDVFERTLL